MWDWPCSPFSSLKIQHEVQFVHFSPRQTTGGDAVHRSSSVKKPRWCWPNRWWNWQQMMLHWLNPSFIHRVCLTLVIISTFSWLWFHRLTKADITFCNEVKLSVIKRTKKNLYHSFDLVAHNCKKLAHMWLQWYGL